MYFVVEFAKHSRAGEDCPLGWRDASSAPLDRGEFRAARRKGVLIAFTLQLVAVLSILLVIFGMPTNLATVLALAGAGITVAIKDFIVGFFGWFVLMGKDELRAGDWVEINGVVGEVLKVGLLHTVILETGNWTDPGHPTGRKVSFVNSYAIAISIFDVGPVALG